MKTKTARKEAVWCQPSKRKGRGKGRQAGMTLVLALGFLAIFMLVMLSLALVSRTARITAGASADGVRSNLLAGSALDRAVCLIQNEFQGDLYPGSRFFNPEADNPWHGRRYLASVNGGDTAGIEEGLSAVMGGVHFTPEASLDSWVGWLPVESTKSIDNSEQDVIIGRYAYVIIDDSGKLDPGAVVSDEQAESSSQQRTGDSPAEISLVNAGISDADAFRPDEVDDGEPGLMPVDGRWFSMDHIAQALNPTQEQMDRIVRALHPLSFDLEKFWRDSNDNGKWDEGEDEDRFDLNDTLTPESLTDLYGLFLGPNRNSLADDCAWLKEAANNPWLANWQNRQDINAIQARQRVAAQAAANILDYCDEDSVPTEAHVDPDGQICQGVSWDEGNYSVYGVERTWGLTEVAMRVRVTEDPTDVDSVVIIEDYTEPIPDIEEEDQIGLIAGHIDVDTSSFIAPSGSGTTDGHVHEYDDKYDVTQVDCFNILDKKLHSITDDLDGDTRFKLIVANANLSPGGSLVINGAPTQVCTYDDTSTGSLPVYSLSGVSASTRLNSLEIAFSSDAIKTGQVIATNTGDVRKNVPGKMGEWRNGSLTLQAVRVDEDGNDAFATDVGRSNGGVQGVATKGLLYEVTIFWHWKGPSYHTAEWDSYDPSADVKAHKHEKTIKVAADKEKHVHKEDRKAKNKGKADKHKDKHKGKGKGKDKGKDKDAPENDSLLYAVAGFKAEAFFPFAENTNAGGVSVTYRISVETDTGATATGTGTVDVPLDSLRNTEGGTLGYSDYIDASEAFELEFVDAGDGVYGVTGDLNINPGKSAKNIFEMETPSGLIDRNTLHASGSAYSYSGSASVVRIKPKSPGQGGASVILDGRLVQLRPNTRYTITSPSMRVDLRNEHPDRGKPDGSGKTSRKRMGQWWIAIDAADATIDPDPLATGGVGDGLGWGAYTVTLAQIDQIVLWDQHGRAVDRVPIAGGSEYLCNWVQNGVSTEPDTLYASVASFDALRNDRGEQDPDFLSCWWPTPDASSLASRDESNVGTLQGSNYQSTEFCDIAVANAPISRLGELGRVASYQPMRSLRLWSTGPASEKGHDADIIDMFKIGSQDVRRGLVNINSLQQPVLQALFADAATRSADEAAEAVLARRLSGTTFTGIGQLLGGVSGISGANPALDDLEESALTKIAQLCTVRPNYFTIVVCAQSVEDVAGVPYDSNGDGTLDATASYGTMDVSRNSDGEVVEYVDPILAEDKILAVIYRDGFTGDMTIEWRAALND